MDETGDGGASFGVGEDFEELGGNGGDLRLVFAEAFQALDEVAVNLADEAVAVAVAAPMGEAGMAAGVPASARALVRPLPRRLRRARIGTSMM